MRTYNAGQPRPTTWRLYFTDGKLSSVNVFCSFCVVKNGLSDEQGPFVTTLILSIHWVQCFICNVVNKWMPEHFNLMVANFTVHVISMIFSITEYVYVHIFRNIFDITFYINISVTNTHVQSENIKSKATCLLCVLTALGLLTWRLDCFL